MSILPFIFFLGLTIYWWNKQKGFDLCVYMSVLYTVCSLFALLLILMESVEGSGILWDGWKVETNFLPTASYCLFIGICLFPFSLVKVHGIEKIQNNAPLTLWGISLLLVVTSLISFYCVADSMLEILNGDFKLLREAHNAGDLSPAEIKASQLPYIAQFLLYFRRGTILCLPIAFYNICFRKAPWWWNAILLFASLTAPINGIQTIDRTEIIYYGLMFITCLIFFYKFMTTRFKIVLGFFSSIAIVMAGIYFIAVSISRFEDTDNGTGVSLLQYGGQGYLNYCYFCENADLNQIATEREFPLLNKYVLHIESNPERRDDRSAKQGFFISVFGAFVGDILLDLGPIGLTIWCIGFCAVVLFVIRNRRRTEFELSEILLLFLFAGVPLFGIFYYRYYSFSDSLSFLLLAFLLLMSHVKFVFHSDSPQ